MHDAENATPRDDFLEERLNRTDRWLRQGGIDFSSKVVPVRESLTAQQWVLPGEQVLEFLRRARSFALIHCVCRSHYHRCDNPTEVCFVLDGTADRYVAEGRGRRISLEEAAAVLRNADAHGLVHLTLYEPERHVYAVCSCCRCCCHDLQFLRRYGRADLVAHSEYVAATDMDLCTHCGDCIDRCPFEARVWTGGEMHYDPAACFGCGLCVSTCSAGATTLGRRGEGL